MEEKIKEFFDKNKEIIAEIAGLTTWILEQDLKDALSIQKGYFKNIKGEYLFVKGIEVTNTGDLLRMGFNGEDRGVWVHYVSLTNELIFCNDVPIASFVNRTDPRCVKESSDLMVPTTKEDFEEQLTKTIKNILSDYSEKRDIHEYLNVLNEWKKLTNLK